MVTIMTLETMHIIQSCHCSGDNCQASGESLKDALISPEIPRIVETTQTKEEPVEVSIDPNMPYAERIRTLFANSYPTPQKFSAFCPSEAHTFQLKGDSGVSWQSHVTKGMGYQHRGKSLHCLLARAVARHPEWPKMLLRISLGDADVGQAYTLAPAASSSSSYAVLFPDYTWESWPEVEDTSSSSLLAQRVLGNATHHGLPDAPEKWKYRDTRAMWRGTSNSLRKDFVSQSKNMTDLLDVQIVNSYEFGGSKGPIPHYISREDHCRYRFLIHLNGARPDRYSSALKWRFLCGSLVFVQTDPLFYEWWNVGMQPYIHYIPFSTADELPNLVREYTTKLDDAAKIAQAGFELAKRAFEHMDDYVDSFLVEYRNLTDGLGQRTCRNKGVTPLKPAEFQTLDQLRAEYGPTVCI